MKTVRDAISPAERSARSRRLADIAFGPLEGAPKVISSFWSMGTEIAPQHMEARLRACGHTIALPVMVGKAKPLIFRTFAPGDPLVERMWDIREPAATAPEVEPDILLVPLLAFDRRGARLGYGGGFYDRTLAALRARKQVLAVGLAFAEQEIDAVPHLDYDERLDWVLTPSGPISCLG